MPNLWSDLFKTIQDCNGKSQILLSCFFSNAEFAACFCQFLQQDMENKPLIESNLYRLVCEVKNVDGTTLLHVAAAWNCTAFIEVCVLLKERLAVGAEQGQRIMTFSFDPLDDKGGSPLCFSVYRRHLQTTRLLIQHGASCSIRMKKNGYTPLNLAVHAGHLPIVRDILATEHGLLTLNLADNKGCSPLAHALQYYCEKKGRIEFEIAAMLLNKGASAEGLEELLTFFFQMAETNAVEPVILSSLRELLAAKEMSVAVVADQPSTSPNPVKMSSPAVKQNKTDAVLQASCRLHTIAKHENKTREEVIDNVCDYS